MKILTAEQIRALDKFTIEHEPIASVDLMERAAAKVFEAVTRHIKLSHTVIVFCGMGNNGGDGLAIARMLIEAGYRHVSTYVVRHSPAATADFTLNATRLENISSIHYIETTRQIPALSNSTIIIDAIFGTGLSRAVSGICAEVINAVNRSGATVYSVDIPSGLFCDKPNAEGDVVMKAAVTFTFHAPKLSFLFAGNGNYVPKFEVLDIGLDKDYAESLNSPWLYITRSMVKGFWKARKKFSHKGSYGHALLAAGSYGKTGAAVLAVRAALRSGAGLVTTNVPRYGYEIIQTTSPEAMVIADVNEEYLTTVPELEKFTAIGAGPGIGTAAATKDYIKHLLLRAKVPMVIDADALNIIAADPGCSSLVPVNTILTPHPGEFKRLAGEWKNDADKLALQLAYSKAHNTLVVLKGAHTSVSTPDGKMYFNSTGNPGMAKGGSGDVLTGIITSLLAQRYTPLEAAVMGIYVHGLAGDLAAGHYGETGMTSGDEIVALHSAFKSLE